MKLFNRSKFITGKKINDYIIQIEASLVDTVHEMVLTIDVDLQDMKIIEASSSMLRVPYSSCHMLSDSVKKLIGLKTKTKGLFSDVRQLIGGPGGCFLLEDLSCDAIKAINQSAVAFIPADKLEYFIDKYLHGTCYTHSLSVEEKKQAAYAKPFWEEISKKI